MSILEMASVQEAIEIFKYNIDDTCNIEDYQEIFKDFCAIDWGETKIVLMREDWDFVLKVPRYALHSTDYCALEVVNYNSAVQTGIEMLLLPAWYVTEVGDIQIYAQAKLDITHFEWEQSHKGYKIKTPAKLISHYRSRLYDDSIPLCWLDVVLRLYGSDVLEKFIQWTNDYAINDLHDCNIGWKNSKPVVLDYSGYIGNSNNGYYYYS